MILRASYLTFVAILRFGYGRELHIADNYVREDLRTKLDMYPEFEECDSSDDLVLQLDFLTQPHTWSPVVNRYLFYDKNKPTGFAEELFVIHVRNKNIKRLVYLPAVVLVCYLIVAILSLVVIPIAGAIISLILAALAGLIFFIFKRVGRSIIIAHEHVRRWRETVIIPPKRKAYKKRFRMPELFRKYSDEEVPTVLQRHRSNHEKNWSDDTEEEERLIEELERKAKEQANFSVVSLKTIKLAKEYPVDPEEHFSIEHRDSQTDRDAIISHGRHDGKLHLSPAPFESDDSGDEVVLPPSRSAFIENVGTEGAERHGGRNILHRHSRRLDSALNLSREPKRHSLAPDQSEVLLHEQLRKKAKNRMKTNDKRRRKRKRSGH